MKLSEKTSSFPVHGKAHHNNQQTVAITQRHVSVLIEQSYISSGSQDEPYRELLYDSAVASLPGYNIRPIVVYVPHFCIHIHVRSLLLITPKKKSQTILF